MRAIPKSKIIALQYPFSLDGALSMFAPDDDGFATVNCYLLLEPGAALLIDTGFAAHRPALLRDLAAQVGEDRDLAVLPLRMGEMNSISNIRGIVSARRVTTLYGNMGDPASLVDFLPQDVPYGTRPRDGVMADLPVALARPGAEVDVAGDGARILDVLAAPLQLLPFSWAYDRRTRTLFSSDVFAYRRRARQSGPWEVTGAADLAPDDDVYRHLTHTRYWWLPGADTSSIRAGLERIFAERPIEKIAPAFGCVITGAAAVSAHFQQLLRLLDRAAADRSHGVAAGTWANWRPAPGARR